MASNEADGLPVSGADKLVELDRSEVFELLTSKKVGRLGFLGPDGPQILPLNYVVVDEHVIVRTVAYGAVARSALDQRVAFEVDDVDDFLQDGWSVLVVGPAQLLSDAQLEQLRLGPAPQPWAEGPRSMFISVGCQQVSGRRLIPS